MAIHSGCSFMPPPLTIRRCSSRTRRSIRKRVSPGTNPDERLFSFLAVRAKASFGSNLVTRPILTLRPLLDRKIVVWLKGADDSGDRFALVSDLLGKTGNERQSHETGKSRQKPTNENLPCASHFSPRVDAIVNNRITGAELDCAIDCTSCLLVARSLSPLLFFCRPSGAWQGCHFRECIDNIL